MIPKIIHHTAPKDKDEWHSIWEECRESWIRNFPGFTFMFWSDEDLDNLINESYSNYYEMYKNFPAQIIRVDFARFCILHKYGGIYSDMDFYCYKNFYDFLDKDLYAVESWEDWGEKMQNSLMVSVEGHEFWILCMKEIYDFYSNNLHILTKDIYDKLEKGSRIELILRIAGPKLFDRTINNYKGKGHILPKELFNPKINLQFNWVADGVNKYKEVYDYYQDLNSKENQVFTRHYLTGAW
jgi:mannosyltransferase OCH1-like enzyme